MPELVGRLQRAFEPSPSGRLLEFVGVAGAEPLGFDQGLLAPTNVTPSSKLEFKHPLCFLVLAPVLATACTHSSVFAEPALSTAKVTEVQTRCPGDCVPTLVELPGGKVIALWASLGGRLWAQSIDAKNGGLLGREVELGYLATPGGAFAQQPLALALPDGDLVLVGRLRDGRVTFARGSDDAARRVAPRVIVPADSRDVLSIAAAESGTGVSLLVLRAPEGYDPRLRRSPNEMLAELYALGPTGESAAPPVRFQTEFGSHPRIASCEGQRYLVWEHANDLKITSVSAGDQRSPQRVLAGRKSLGWPGPIVCDGADAVLAQSWQRDVFASENLPELTIARITPAGAKPKWKTIQLAAPPRDVQAVDGRPAVQLRRDRLYAWIGTTGRDELVRVPLTTLKVQRLPLAIPPHQAHCVALADGARALCAASKAPDPQRCTTAPSRTTFSFVGYEKLAPRREASSFWNAAGSIPDPQSPSASERSWQRGRVMCGDPGWSDVRDALEAWCSGDPKADTWRAEPSLCGHGLEHSLRYQATHCTNEPVTCEPTRHRLIPSVDRAAFERGEHVELSYQNCSLYFEREAGKLQVSSGECTGE